MVRERWAEIHRYVRWKLWQSSDSEDITQSVFITAWRKRDLVPDLPIHWLKGVALNDLRNYRRTSRTFQRWHVFSDVDLAELSPAPGDDFAAVVARDAIARILRLLPEFEARLLRLRYLNDLSFADVGAALGMERGHVSIRVYRALERARAVAVGLDIVPSPGLPSARSGRTAAGTPPGGQAGLSVEMRLRLAEGDPSAVQFLSSRAGDR